MSGSTPQGEDIVGDRVLVGLQSVRISRLSTHPIPVAAGTLIAVAGQGPKDSNGAGKSSLLAQISLLHADEQWRFGSGAPAAVDLLFNSEDAGGEDRWGNADHGYLIGVFAPAAGTLDQLQACALTVWIRIDRSNQKGPRLKLRWRDGLHLPVGDSEAEREQAADSVWQALPPRAGRQDVAARDLPRTLYGEHVRCVSFLSTSVRASAAPNLLAQPLNEISERRIFEAIAALTGIDTELEKERQARRHEYDRRQEASGAESDLATWEESAQVIEDGIDARDRARELVVEAADRWRSRTARLLCDALQRDADIQVEIAEIDTVINRDIRTAQELARQAAELADDEAFTRRQQAAMSTFGKLDSDDRELGNQIATLEQQIEDIDRLLRAAREAARDADGRNEQAAERERAEADAALEDTVKAVGVAEKALSDAESSLRDAESGRDLAQQQIEILAAEGIGAIGLLDAVVLDEPDRARWEAALWPYREAAVVDSEQLNRASQLLAGIPGSILIAANRASSAPGRLPGSADPEYDVSGFLAALHARTTARSDPDRVYDDAGIVVVGGFSQPATGRATRIAAARERVRQRSTAHEDAVKARNAAGQKVISAERRQKGARAAAEAYQLEGQAGTLRKKDQATRQARGELAPTLSAAQAERDAVLRLAGVRQQQIESLQRQKTTLDNTNKTRREKHGKLEEEQSQLGLPELIVRWDGTPDSASEYLRTLPDNQQSWSADDWWEEAKDLISTAISECFPPTASDTMPMEITGLLEESSQRGPGSSRRAQVAFAPLLRALRVYLRQQEGTDQYERQQIAIQREERHKSLAAARIGHEEAVQASRAYRGALTSAIKKTLADVAAEFDRLDGAYGGYGASLHYEDPPPPADPTEAWGWKVTPMWRRAEGRRHIPYDRRANTAQIDDRAIKLVCAAAAASGTGRPLVLVLDELGRNLGKQHRREAVALLGQIGRDSGITVVGALQDDMETYAIDACGQYVKLRRSSDSSPYNEQPVVVGYDEHAPRVELLRAWLTGNGYREPA
ncbi:hypothetical protein GA0070216_12828 [Micromonospora matsumotoense]|uniref:Chromosome segregation ATPase n=1 Tax=Micromonospora matsumotoense TaxID=121616 RepID=A0A1C5ATZ7_9ACTN|nr:hypothetical protein [Micromonospora matsumotoense]SCF48718.1 hypothetical protein GA0070216_12828 [Micromonospora matsumotoense]